jgi:molybdopterin/thiamine biosynthesis adenylyltransferase
MMELTLSAHDAARVAQEVLGHGTERCVVLLASRAIRSDGFTRLLVRQIDVPAAESYAELTPISAELNPAYVARVGKLAARSGYSLVFVHSHAGEACPDFSSTDDRGEKHLATFLAARTPGIPHAALVMSASGWRARRLGSSEPIRVVTLGAHRRVLFEPAGALASSLDVFDRQVRAFGAAGQHLIGSLTVCLVGLGGTGSIAAQQLAYLGVRHFILVDPDRIEATNLNRVVGATPPDIGLAKVAVAARMVGQIAPDAAVRQIVGDVTRTPVAQELKDADFIFSCTDSHGSRAVIQQVAYQYLIPAIDIGSIITAGDGRTTGIHGRVQALGPGLPCLTCTGLIDSEQVRRDLMSEEERRLDPYIQGAHEPAPAVISINGTVTSLAVSMFMGVVVGLDTQGRHLLYNAHGPSLRSVAGNQVPTCYICSHDGVLARGDSQLLFTRDVA